MGVCQRGSLAGNPGCVATAEDTFQVIPTCFEGLVEFDGAMGRQQAVRGDIVWLQTGALGLSCIMQHGIVICVCFKQVFATVSAVAH